MKKILLILVGGTICTEKTEKGTLAVQENAGDALLNTFRKSDAGYTERVCFTLTPNLGILSENMTVDKWNLILETFRTYRKKEIFDGVIFAHGTDTLAFSAALFSMALCDTDVPVFLVSSNARLSLAHANGGANFRAAVDCILQGIAPNIYVPYKNISDGTMYLHIASRLTQCPSYSEDFRSEGMMLLPEEIDAACVQKISALYPETARKPLVESMGDWRLKNVVLKLMPYVGLDYSSIRFENYRAVLHGTYHSGTTSADREEKGMFSRYAVLHMLAQNQNMNIYLSPAKKDGEIYDSVREIYENGEKIHFLYGMTDEAAYAKLLLAYSLPFRPTEIETFINTECNFEMMK